MLGKEFALLYFRGNIMKLEKMENYEESRCS
jgi:hypothetical protein